MTTYELESLHAGGLAAVAFGIAAPPAATKPGPGRAADLKVFAPKQVGHACWFSAGPLAGNPLHTTADWLLELTQGFHFRDVEDAFIDLMSLVDQADAAFGGHPFVRVLRADDHERAIGLRGQMTRLTATLVGGKPLEQTSIEWWRANLSMAPNPVAPDTPYRDAATRWRVNGFPGALQFEDLMPKTPANPNGRGLPSGLSIFDLDSAFIASDRMGLPLPVLLALMETEGVNLFAPVNRLVRQPTPVDDDTKTVSWEAQSRDTTNMLRPPIADVEAGVAAARLAAWRQTVGRAFWLSFPYGLDRFTLVDDAAVNARSDQFVAAKILVKDADERSSRTSERASSRVFIFARHRSARHRPNLEGFASGALGHSFTYGRVSLSAGGRGA